MFASLRKAHQEWSSKLQSKIDSTREQAPNNPLIQELEEEKLITSTKIVELGSNHNMKSMIDKIGLQMQKSITGSVIDDIHSEFIQITGLCNQTVSYLVFDTFWKNFNLTDRSLILRNIINTVHIRNLMDYQDPVSSLRIAELILPTAAHSQNNIENRYIFNFLLEKSNMVDALDENGHTALSIMVCQNIPSNVKILLEKGANISATTKDLWFELLNNFYKQTSILDTFDIPTDVTGLWGAVNIHYDVNNPVIVNIINNLQDNIHSNIREDGYFTSGDNAIKIMRLLSEHGLNINSYVNTPLGNKTVFQGLCEMRYNALESIWMLNNLMNIPEFDINSQNDGITPFMISCNAQSSTAEIIASQENFDVTLVDKNGYGSIHHLFRLDDVNLSKRILDILIAKGANVNLVSSDGKTPISFFLEHKKEDLAEYLLTKYDVDLENADYNGLYPIHIAAIVSSPKMIELLSTKGASLTQEVSCHEKYTPITLAQKYFNVDVVDYLESHTLQHSFDINHPITKVYKKVKPEILACNEKITNDLENPQYYHDRGALFQELTNYDAALKDYNKVIELRPDVEAIYAKKGSVLLNLGRFYEALDSANQAISLNEYYYEAYKVQGVSLANIGKFEEAISSFNAGIAINPSFADFFYNKGLASYHLGKFEDALENYKIAISKNPTPNKMYYAATADALLGAGRQEDAIYYYEMARNTSNGLEGNKNFNINQMLHLNNFLSINNEELIPKIQELQALSIASMNRASALDPSNPVVESINKNNLELQELANQLTLSNSIEDSLKIDKLIKELFAKVMQLQTQINDIQESKIADIHQRIDSYSKTIDSLQIRQDEIAEITRVSNEYNQEIILELEQKFIDKYIDFQAMRDDLTKYQNDVREIEQKISILQSGMEARRINTDDMQILQDQVKQYYDEMILLQEKAASTVLAIKELEPICISISQYIKEANNTKSDMASIFRDQYKIDLFHHLMQELSSVYLASSVVCSNIVSNNKSGSIGNAGSIIKFIGAYVPVIGFAVQLVGTVLSKLDHAQQTVMIQNFFDIANSPDDFNDLTKKFAIKLLDHEDMSEILDFNKLEEQKTLSNKLQKIFGGVFENIFSNVKEISHFMSATTKGKSEIAITQIVELLQDEINNLGVQKLESPVEHSQGKQHGGKVATIIISKIYTGAASSGKTINDNNIKSDILLDLVLDEYGFIPQEIVTESEKIAIKTLEYYKTFLNLPENYSDQDLEITKNISSNLLDKTYYRKLLCKASQNLALSNEISMNVATKLCSNNNSILSNKIGNILAEVLVHQDFVRYLTINEIHSDIVTNNTHNLNSNLLLLGADDNTSDHIA